MRKGRDGKRKEKRKDSKPGWSEKKLSGKFRED